MSDLLSELRAAIRDVPDFPKPGIVFKDITPLLANGALFERATRAMAEPFRNSGITHVVAIESRGFLLGGPIAQALNAGLIPVRKPGKLPAKTASVEYALEYGTDRLEIHDDACDGSMKVLVVDDVLATGGTAAATGKLVSGRGAEVAGFSFLMGLTFLNGRAKLPGSRISELITY
jgi:adenine phosphoribosyltransferase